jgi:hypothetical protein
MDDKVPVIFVEDPSETFDETLRRLAITTGHRLGSGKTIELILADMSHILEENWLGIFPEDFKANWIPELENNAILREVPDIGEFNPELNPENFTDITVDSPSNRLRSQIRYNIIRSENAGFARKMFSGTKELKPRFRYYRARRNNKGYYEYTKIYAKTNEHLVEFDCFSRSRTETNFLFKCMEYIFYMRGTIFLDLGLQRFIPLGSPRRMTKDDKTLYFKKTLSVYFRTEEYFYEDPVIQITEASMDWEDFILSSQ